MGCLKELQVLIAKNNGLLLTKEVTKAGIPREYIIKLVRMGELKRLERGIYTSNNIDDKLYRLQTKHSKLVFSHSTALFLYKLIDEILPYEVTVPAGYNSQNLKESGIIVHSVKKELYDLGICYVKNQYGREIKTYDIERTICDILKKRNQIDISTLTRILKVYGSCNKKDFNKLMKYAEILRVSKILNIYSGFFVI
ncbi:MAG: type IV toxin-antitoxin system AbiEi family antitoxin domain-containing protein [Clostridiales bacterium]|nr:type IV toxin-antitoxin system AbiEi family antitoxin domain-containing protein [Clostridiales bacterium]